MTTEFNIPAEREGRAAPPDLAERREQMGTAIAAGAFATQHPVEEISFAGLRTLRFRPANAKPKGYMLQLHGGGFRIGRPEFEAPLCERLAEQCQIEVIVPQYRLSPETPFPGGFNDALAALSEFAAIAGDAPLIVGGDSAGAGLAASLGVFCQADNTPRIAGLALLSPWLDLTVTAPSFDANASDPMFSTESAQVAAELYLQGFDPLHPLASPLFAEIKTYPPTLISVGSGEVLLDDSLRFHEKLLQAGVASELSRIDGMDHVAVVRGFDLPGSAETLDTLVSFIDRIISKS